jgi:multidrug resistance efflux pump
MTKKSDATKRPPAHKKTPASEPNDPPAKTDGSMAPEAAEPVKKKMDPVRKLILIVLPICTFVFIWHVLSDRYVPSTGQAQIHAYIVPIAPQVSGIVTEVMVSNNVVVSKGQSLLQIDRSQYELAVANAEAALEQAGQSAGADTAAVAAAQASLVNARAKLRQARENYELVKSVYDKDPGAVSKFELTNRKTFVDVADSRVSAAEADLARAQEQLGKTGEENTKIRSALAALERAKLDLKRTTVRSPGVGGITDLRIDDGQYASPGQALMTYVSSTDVWIRADIRENGIEHIDAGDPVEILLDAAPGRVYQGKVASIGWGISADSSGALGTLPTAAPIGGWLSDAKRFPVIIKFADDQTRGFRRPGGRATVTIYTGDHPILNALGRMWMRVLSVLSYAY